MTEISECAWYVYAVLPAMAELRPSGRSILPGADIVLIGDTPLPDQSVTDVTSEGLRALASLVPRNLFAADHPANRAHDPDWIAARAADHHAVVLHAAATAPCLPLGFGTLFSTSNNIRLWLQSNAESLNRALSEVAGREEWGVCLTETAEVHIAWLTANDPALAAMSRDVAAATPGTGYLLARRLSRANDAARVAHTSTMAAQIEARLAQMSCRLRVEPAGPGAAATWSALAGVGCPVATHLADLADDLDDMGLHLRVDGPWPPYAFARAAWQEAQDV